MRELRVEDALLYLDQVKLEFGDRPHIYNEFLDIMKTFKTQQIDTPGVIRRVSNLFQGNKRLVLGFNTFLPEGYQIELPADGDGPPVAVYRDPHSNKLHRLDGTEHNPEVKPPAQPAMEAQPPPPADRAAPAPPAQQPPQQMQQQGPLEFDHAINYVTSIKKRFASEPETYKKFLEILHTYQKEQRGIKEVLDEVSALFAEHPDLLTEFTYFLPDAVQGQAKAQLEAAARQAEARQRQKAEATARAAAQRERAANQPIPRAYARQEFDRSNVPIAFGASQARSLEREKAIVEGAKYGVASFAPVRPPRAGEPTPVNAALSSGRPTSIPSFAFQLDSREDLLMHRVKAYLSREELQGDADSPHTPYEELLKCLHLLAAGLVTLMDCLGLCQQILYQGHAPKTPGNAMPEEIVKEADEIFELLQDLFVSRGLYNLCANSWKQKSVYGVIPSRDFVESSTGNPTPSYYTYPPEFQGSPKQFLYVFSAQAEEDQAVLNHELFSCGKDVNDHARTGSIEECAGMADRYNEYEETLAKIEDERFEVDMAIERNAQTMRVLEPYAEEAHQLREQEERDGQPIGRLQYSLKEKTLNTVHINSIGRLYGEGGDEVLQHLVRNPIVVLPLVYQRLKQKDAEWRKAKEELTKKWNVVTEACYEGAFDVLCFQQRRAVELTCAKAKLIDQCKHTRKYESAPDKIFQSPEAQSFAPSCGLSLADDGAIMYQPYLSVNCQLSESHKEAFQLISGRINSDLTLPALTRERVGRIWAEFMVPWFGYEAHWVLDEVRNSCQLADDSSVVKFVPGQRVATIFGEGTVMSRSDAVPVQYRIKLPFGVSTVNPSAILNAVQSKSQPMVRRDGLMVRDEMDSDSERPASTLDEKFELLFGTENVYLFLRLYVIVCKILAEVRDYCGSNPPAEDPADSYYVPVKKPGASSGKRLDFSAILASLKSVSAGKADPKEAEAVARKVARGKTHEVAALPRLIESCAHFLVKIAEEDTLLQLYDFCQLREADPVAVRAHCFSVAADAFFRVQYDTTSGEMYFSYLPKGRPLLLEPSNAIEDDEDDAMEEDEEVDPIEQDEPIAKRMKL